MGERICDRDNSLAGLRAGCLRTSRLVAGTVDRPKGRKEEVPAKANSST